MSSTEPEDLDQGKPAKASWSFIVFMLVLTALFAYLGNWQVNRLAEKETMLSAVAERVGLEPVGLPPTTEWVGFDPQTYDFRQIAVTGIFDHSNTVRVFTSLADTVGTYSGAGYWVLAPLLLEQGGIIFVNRGFVPENDAARFVTGGAGPSGEVTITGVGRITEKVNSFTPGADFQNSIDWVRNIDRLAQFLNDDSAPIVQIYLDQQAGALGALPQGGETKFTIINRHFEYALTWYALALLTPFLLLVWWFNSTRKPKL